MRWNNAGAVIQVAKYLYVLQACIKIFSQPIITSFLHYYLCLAVAANETEGEADDKESLFIPVTGSIRPPDW